MKLPHWLEDLLGTIFDGCVSDVKGRMSGFSYRWSKPDDNGWGTWLLQIAPSVLEIAGGKDDGAKPHRASTRQQHPAPPCVWE